MAIANWTQDRVKEQLNIVRFMGEFENILRSHWYVSRTHCRRHHRTRASPHLRETRKHHQMVQLTELRKPSRRGITISFKIQQKVKRKHQMWVEHMTLGSAIPRCECC